MVFNRFCFIVLIWKCFLGAISHSEVAISNSPSKTLTSTPKKSCSIPDFREPEYIYLSLEGNKLDREKCYDGSGKFGVRVSCFDDTKIIEPDSFAACFDGKWYPSVHTCVQKTCQPVNDTVSTRHTCTTSKGDEVSCRLPAVPGTKITIRCAHWRYGFESFENSTVIDRFCQKSGQWQTLENCTPKPCSTKTPDTSSNNSSLEANSSSSLKLAKKFPWNAVIYRRNGDGWSRVCFGTVITDRIILTSTDYFYKSNREKETLLERGIIVAVGEYFKNYEDYDQEHLYDVIRIHPTIPSIFGIPLAYIVVVSRDIEFSDTVGFACLGIHTMERKLMKNFKTVANITIIEKESNLTELSLTIEPCDDIIESFKSHLFCSPTNNHTFARDDELGGGLIFFENSRTYLGGLLFTDSPGFLDIGILQNRFYIEKEVANYYYSIGKRNENWSRKWGF